MNLRIICLMDEYVWSYNDYDYVVVPKKSVDFGIKKRSEYVFESYSNIFTPKIINWNYEILEIR